MTPLNNLVILTTPVGQFLGKHFADNYEGVSVTHLVTLTEPADGGFTLLPEPMPLSMVTEQVGEDMVSFFPLTSPSICSSLPLTEDSPHRIVKMFIEYWGLSGKLENQANPE